MKRPFRIKLTDDAGQSYHWTVRHYTRAWLCGDRLTKGRYSSGWAYTDHDGVERCVEGNWLALVDAFRLTATNYGFTTNIS